MTVAVSGTDTEGDVVGLNIVVRDAGGVDLFAENPIPTVDLVAEIAEDGSFTGEFLGQFPQGFSGASIATVDVAVVDRAGLTSNIIEGVTASQPASIAVGEACDPNTLSSDCGAAGICSQVGEVMEGEEPVFQCEAADAACPAAFGEVPAFEALENGEGWTTSGNTEGGQNTTQGTCGEANGPEGVASFTTADGGFFVCEIDADEADTVMYVRSFSARKSKPRSWRVMTMQKKATSAFRAAFASTQRRNERLTCSSTVLGATPSNTQSPAATITSHASSRTGTGRTSTSCRALHRLTIVFGSTSCFRA